MIFLSGCGTFMRSTYNFGAPGELYPAFNVDVQGWSFAAKPEPWSGRYPAPMSIFCWRTICVIDMPISLLTDTLIFPYDLIKKEPPINIEVTDVCGVAVPEAEVSIWEINGRNSKGFTDQSGIYIFSGNNELINVIEIHKEGYYQTTQEQMEHRQIISSQLKNRTYSLNLKKVVNPVPMYGKAVSVELPVVEGSFGYDLEVGDLVQPDGFGKTSDFIFHVKSTGKQLLSLDISFSSPEDGIQPFFISGSRHAPKSALRSSYNAPEQGYFSSLKDADENGREIYSKYKFPKYEDIHNFKDDINYYFRIRSGKKQCWYGKIYGSFHVQEMERDHKIRALVNFGYYVTPDGTTNIECDPKKCLFPEKSFKRYYFTEYGICNP